MRGLAGKKEEEEEDRGKGKKEIPSISHVAPRMIMYPFSSKQSRRSESRFESSLSRLSEMAKTGTNQGAEIVISDT